MRNIIIIALLLSCCFAGCITRGGIERENMLGMPKRPGILIESQNTGSLSQYPNGKPKVEWQFGTQPKANQKPIGEQAHIDTKIGKEFEAKVNSVENYTPPAVSTPPKPLYGENKNQNRLHTLQKLSYQPVRTEIPRKAGTLDDNTAPLWTGTPEQDARNQAKKDFLNLFGEHTKRKSFVEHCIEKYQKDIKKQEQVLSYCWEQYSIYGTLPSIYGNVQTKKKENERMLLGAMQTIAELEEAPFVLEDGKIQPPAYNGTPLQP